MLLRNLTDGSHAEGIGFHGLSCTLMAIKLITSICPGTLLHPTLHRLLPSFYRHHAIDLLVKDIALADITYRPRHTLQ